MVPGRVAQHSGNRRGRQRSCRSGGLHPLLPQCQPSLPAQRHLGPGSASEDAQEAGSDHGQGLPGHGASEAALGRPSTGTAWQSRGEALPLCRTEESCVIPSPGPSTWLRSARESKALLRAARPSSRLGTRGAGGISPSGTRQCSSGRCRMFPSPAILWLKVFDQTRRSPTICPLHRHS